MATGVEGQLKTPGQALSWSTRWPERSGVEPLNVIVSPVFTPPGDLAMNMDDGNCSISGACDGSCNA